MTATTAPAQPRARRTGGTSLARRALRVRRTQVGLVLTLAVLAVAFLGPLLAPYAPTTFVGQPYLAHVHGTVFGTDNLGRDALSRFLEGGRWLLLLAALATLVGVGTGAVVGLVAGYFRGWADEGLMRGGDVLLAFPQVVIALLLLSVVGPKMWLLVLVVALGHAPRTARVVRGAALTVVGRDFVGAAEAAGVPSWRILLREILPNVTGTLMVEVGLRLTYSIGLIAALSFLGLGIQPPAADWGLMINENRVAMTVQPWPVVLPVLAVAVLTVGTNLMTDGLARASAGIGRGVES